MTLAEIDVAMMDLSEKDVQSEEEMFSKMLAPVMIRLGYESMPARGAGMHMSPKDYLNRRD